MATPDDRASATQAAIRERIAVVTAADLNPDAFCGGPYAAVVRLARDDIPSLLAAIDALTAALERHRPWFINDAGVKICGGCLDPAPCKDDPEAIVAAALEGKGGSDGN